MGNVSGHVGSRNNHRGVQMAIAVQGFPTLTGLASELLHRSAPYGRRHNWIFAIICRCSGRS